MVVVVVVGGVPGKRQEGKWKLVMLGRFWPAWGSQVHSQALFPGVAATPKCLLTPPSPCANGLVLDADLLVEETFRQAQVSCRRTHTFLIAKVRTHLTGEGSAVSNYTEITHLYWGLMVSTLISSTWN